VNLEEVRSRNQLEEEIDTKLLTLQKALAGEEKKKVYFLTGHRESSVTDTAENGLSQFAFMLEKEFIAYDELFLPSEKKIPGDCDLLIIAGPGHKVSEDTGLTETLFEPEELRIISEYLNTERRNLLVFAGPEFSRVEFDIVERMNTDENAAIEPGMFLSREGLLALLAGEGFLISNGLLFHDRFHITDDNTLLINDPVAGNVITQQREYQIVMPSCTPVFIPLESPVHHRFIESRENTWIENILESDGEFDPQKELKYSRGVTGAVSYARSEEGRTDRRIVVIGSSLLPVNRYINLKDNRQLLRRTVNWLLSKENFSITRNYTRVSIAVSETAKNAVFYISVIAVPFMFLGIAMLVWWDRR
jgi:hypothetical protein